MSEYLKEVAKGLITFANLFSILVFFKADNWINGFFAIIMLYILSAGFYYYALKREKRNG
ncbi:hypothetical protein JHD48_06460 [Sulfurimonas sp. SAG-AH-194-I05]|nr:hypothetical protein [Sulfurimonas sp. SAG-AH-194-I05]MDF1875371.1 hypothetical protein [Sulfurimonas sp. SAG-AH-194-I05]